MGGRVTSWAGSGSSPRSARRSTMREPAAAASCCSRENPASARRGSLTNRRHLATAKGMRVRWGRCWEGGGAPAHWPWIQVIREVVAESDAPSVRSRNLSAEIARILPELSSEVSEPEAHVDAEQARFRLFDAVATLLKESAREHPIVIVLDDLHEADTASLQMLQFIARVLHDANVLIIGTYREAEMRRSTERSPLMDEIVRDALVLPIAALTESEVGDLVAGRAAGAPAIGIVAELHRATAGNPLFVDGVLRALAAEGRLGEWRAHRPRRIQATRQRARRNPAPARSAVCRRARRADDRCGDRPGARARAGCAGPRARRGEARGADGRGGGDGNRRRRGTIVIPFYASAVARGALR